MRKVRPQSPYQWSLPNTKVPFLAPDVVTKVIPSPVEGWDAISPLAEMDPKRAPILTNWVPRPGYVALRGGYIPYANILGTAPVETLMAYVPPESGAKLFAAASNKFYDVTNGGSSTAVVTGLTNARWQYTNFTTPVGVSVIQCVNGADSLQQWNGSVWSEPSITGLPGSGLTSTISNIFAQKQRLWYVIQNSTTVAFMPTGAISGAIAGTQVLGQLWSKGGFLVAMADWTVDGGNGPQDYVCFISSMGEISIFAGTDPTNASTWQLVGTFALAPPIGTRCAFRLGSDVAVITQQGVIPLSQALPFDPSADRSVAITARIQNAMAQSAMLYQNNFGWELSVYPNQQLLIVNIPVVSNSSQIQYVMNTLTGAWCNFSGWNANTFVWFNNNLYFGDNAGYVNQAYTGTMDFLTPIQADMQCAFNWLDEPGRTKRMTMVQPLLIVSPGLTPTMSVDTDFTTSSATAPISTVGGTVLWGTAIWGTSIWPVASTVYDNFLTVEAIGHALAMRMRVNVQAATTLLGLFDTAQFDTSEFDESLDPTIPTLQVNAFNSIAELGG